MTKKHFQGIADAIKASKSHIDNLAERGLINRKEWMDFYSGVKLAENYITEALQGFNPLFDRTRFIIACETIDIYNCEHCGKKRDVEARICNSCHAQG